MKLIIFIIFMMVFINEIHQGIQRQKDRQIIFKLAQTQSLKIGKPLLVYGDPFNGIGSKFFNLFMSGYECGDETVDLTGCPNCPNGKMSDILVHLKSKESNSQVIFISCVLEYVDNIDEVISELKRVSGGLDNIFVVTVGNMSLAAYLYREDGYKAKNIVYAPPKYKDLKYKKI